MTQESQLITHSDLKMNKVKMLWDPVTHAKNNPPRLITSSSPIN